MSVTARIDDEPLVTVRQTPDCGADYPMGLEEMARVLGISHQGVQQAIAKAIRKLWRRGLSMRKIRLHEGAVSPLRRRMGPPSQPPAGTLSPRQSPKTRQAGRLHDGRVFCEHESGEADEAPKRVLEATRLS